MCRLVLQARFDVGHLHPFPLLQFDLYDPSWGVWVIVLHGVGDVGSGWKGIHSLWDPLWIYDHTLGCVCYEVVNNKESYYEAADGEEDYT